MVAKVIGGVDVATHKQKLFPQSITYLIIVSKLLATGNTLSPLQIIHASHRIITFDQFALNPKLNIPSWIQFNLPSLNRVGQVGRKILPSLSCWLGYFRNYGELQVIVQLQHMKTSESFFPTRTNLKSRQHRHQNTYQLIRRQENQEIEEDDDFTINIFRQDRQPFKKPEINHAVTRPVGGMDLFRKMELAGRERMNENRRHSKRSNKQSTQRNISSNFNNNRFKKEKLDAEDRENQDIAQIKVIPEVASSQQLRSSLPEETLKSHISYHPHPASAKSHTRQLTIKTIGRSQVAFRPSSSKPSSKTGQMHDEWAFRQRREYQDKAALLNEINYNKPLVEIYGDRYFQYMLRNRFEEDLKPPAYIYQIGPAKFSESRAIDKIKKYRPDVKQKQMMIIRGKRLGDQTDKL